MRKLKLDLARLKVDSFTVPDTGRSSGTVRGHDSGTDATVCWGACGGGDSYYITCTYVQTCDTLGDSHCI